MSEDRRVRVISHRRLDMRVAGLTIRRITLPVPFPLKTANVYLVGTPGGTILVDTAFYTPDAWERLRSEVITFTADCGPLRTIVLTHHHPDHVGMAGRLQERYEVPVLASPEEATLIAQVWGPCADRHDTEFYQMHGMPAIILDSITREHDGLLSALAPLPRVDAIIAGRPLALGGLEFAPVITPGHSPAHLCLWHAASGILLVGDHLLPHITPNIGWDPYSGPDPLDDFLVALGDVERLPVQKAYPGHGLPIDDVSGRITELRVHHAERLHATRALLDGDALTGYQVAERLFGSDLSPQEVRFAVVETLAHLEYLRRRGDIATERRGRHVVYRIR